MEVLKEYYKLKGDTLLIVQKENRDLNRELSQTKSNLSNTTTDLEATKSSLAELKTRQEKLTNDYRELEKNLQKLSTSSQTEAKSLRGQLNQANRENVRMKSILTNLDNAYRDVSEDGNQAEDKWSTKFLRMQEISETLTSENAQLNTLMELLSPLPIFQEENFEIVKTPGQLVIRLSVDEIFRSNKTQLNTKGRNTVEEITGIILSNSNLEVYVEGHTDNKGSDSNNWNASVIRAAAVAKQMIIHDFTPERLHAIGRSSHHPINPDDSSKARAQNRRMEIIIKPKSKLP